MLNTEGDENMEDYIWPKHFSAAVSRGAFGNRLCGYLISLEAWRRGLSVTVEAYNSDKFAVYSISSRDKVLKFDRSRIGLTLKKAVKAIINKDTTRKLLQGNGVPTPQGAKFDSSDDMSAVLDYATELTYPVVVKPVSGSLGRGVFSDIKNADELSHYCHHLRTKLSLDEFIVEKHFKGEDYRVFATREEMIAAVKRVPANVTGDGESTIDDLIKRKNLERKKNPFLSKGLIKKDDEVIRYIHAAGYKIDSILPLNEVLPLRGKANASAGGDVIDVTDKLPDAVREAAISSIRAIPGLEYCGADILYNEESGDFCVIELNSRAQIGVNMYPTHGVGQDIPKAIIDTYFPEAPRKHQEINPHLVFDVNAVLSPLITGVLSRVTIAPVKEYADFNRKYILLKECSIRSRVMLEKKLRKLAKEYDVVGRVESKMGRDLALYAAGDRFDLTSFLDSVERVVECQEKIVKNWIGIVKQGFYVDIKQ
jgi:cyanophycin synthetase